MPNEIAVTATPLSVSPPSAAGVCRLYIFFVKLDGSPAENVRLTAANRYVTVGSDQFVYEGENTVLSDATGLAQLDVVQGTKVRVSIHDALYVREITVPGTSSANLLTVLGETSDAFTVVRD